MHLPSRRISITTTVFLLTLSIPPSLLSIQSNPAYPTRRQIPSSTIPYATPLPFSHALLTSPHQQSPHTSSPSVLTHHARRNSSALQITIFTSGLTNNPPHTCHFGVQNVRATSAHDVTYCEIASKTPNEMAHVSNLSLSLPSGETLTIGKLTNVETSPTSITPWNICLVTQIRPFQNLLSDWVTYHLQLGISHILILDNSPTRNQSESLRSVQAREKVEVIWWPWRKSQVQALTFAISAGTNRCKWVIATDVDEFIMMDDEKPAVGKGDLAAYLDQLDRTGVREVLFPYRVMASTQEEADEQNEDVVLAERYVHLMRDGVVKNGKSACDVSYGGFHRSGVHNCAPKGGDGEWKIEREGRVSIVHFKYRTWREWKEKMQLGSGSSIDVGNFGRVLQSVAPMSFWRGGDIWFGFRDAYRRVMKH